MVDPTKSPLEYLCDAAFQGVVRQLTKGYIVAGSSGQLQVGSAGGGTGMDLVWDLWNEQFAAYWYPQGSLSVLNIQISANAYAGFGFGIHPHIHSAWSGWFRGGTASFGIDVYRLINISGSISYFESPDRSTVGGLVGLSGSLGVPELQNLVRLPLRMSSAEVAAGFWTPWDAVTRRLFNPRIHGSHVIAAQAADDRNHAIVNMEPGVWGLSRHIQHVLGTNPLSVGFSFYAQAISLLKEFMDARGMGTNNREAGLDALHNWACSETYRLIQNYRRDVPAGTEQRGYPGGHTIARTPRGKYLITSTVGGGDAVGAWTTVMKLRTAGNGYGGVPSIRYGMALSGAPRGVIDGRSVGLSEMSQRIQDVRDRMNAA